MIFAAIDPGKLTGVCVVEFIDLTGRIDAITAPDTRLIESAELEFPEYIAWVERVFMSPEVERVAIEAFLITPQTGRNSQAPWSLECIGVAREWTLRSQTPLSLQKPADAISLVSNDLLRSLKLWHRGGAGHANDALRHAVLLAIRKGWRSPNLVSDTA